MRRITQSNATGVIPHVAYKVLSYKHFLRMQRSLSRLQILSDSEVALREIKRLLISKLKEVRINKITQSELAKLLQSSKNTFPQ